MSLNQFVLVKQVPDPEALVRVRGAQELEVEPKLITNFFDEIAIEQALRLRSQVGGTVTAVTVGSGKEVDAVRRALAMGVDKAIQIDDPALTTADGIGIGRALAALITEEGGAHLVFCGRVSADNEAGLVGPVVAECLGAAHAMSVVELELGQSSVKVARQVERGVEVLDLPLPAVIGVQKGLCEPRVPKVMKVMKAAKAKIDSRDLAALGISADDVAPLTELVRYESPGKRGPVRMAAGDFPANVDDLVRMLRDEAKVIR